MPTISSTTTHRDASCASASDTSTVSALSLAIDDARARLDAALGDLQGLATAGELPESDVHALEAEYVDVYLARVAALEQFGALACTPDEWAGYEAKARGRSAGRTSAKARRDRLRDALTARQCLVVALGRISDPVLAALVADEPDVETFEIRAELAACELL